MPTRGHAWLRRVVGFTVGFGAALAIIAATEVSRAVVDDEAPARVVGEIDVFAYCRSGEITLEAALRSDDAYGWRCVGRRNGIWGFEEIDFDEACHRQFGTDTYAVTTDPSSPYAWFCETSG